MLNSLIKGEIEKRTVVVHITIHTHIYELFKALDLIEVNFEFFLLLSGGTNKQTVKYSF